MFTDLIRPIVLISATLACGARAHAQACNPFWQPGFAPTGASSTVNALCVYDDQSGSGPALYAGGIFSTMDGITVNRIAKFNGTSWSALGSGVSGSSAQVFAMAAFDDGAGPALYVGGHFTSAGGAPANYIARWKNGTWSAVGSGFNDAVRAMAVHDDGAGAALYVGGSFTIPSEVGNTNRIMKWDGTSWSEVGPWMNNITAALKVFGAQLYAGGAFDTIGGTSISKIARWNGTTWTSVGIGTTNASSVDALTVFDDGNGPALYAGGIFTRISGVFANQIAKWDGTTWAALGDGLNNTVRALAAFDEGSGTGPALYAAGTFTASGAQTLRRIARWRGPALGWSEVGSTVNAGADNGVLALAVYDDGKAQGPALYAGGQFTGVDGWWSVRLAKWVGCPYQWINPANGDYHVVSNWSTNRLPSADNLVLFGQNVGANPFSVWFTQDAECQSLRVTKQRPRIDFNGNILTVHGSVNVGEDQVGILRLAGGTLITPRTTVELLGRLLGDAAIESKLTNRGIVQPGLPVGTLNVVGEYTQEPSGTFRVGLGPNDFDVMNVNGPAQLAGTIDIQLRDGADPQPGQNFQVLNASSISGSFGALLAPYLGPERTLQVQYSSSARGSGIVITVGSPNGNPDFGNPQSFVLEGIPTAVTGAEVDPIVGASDLALSVAALDPKQPGNVLVLVNQNDGTSFTPVVVPVGKEPSGIGAASLADGGSNDDFAVPNKGDHTVSILFYEGSNTFTEVVVALPAGSEPSAITAGDFRGIGLTDLAVTNQGLDTVTILQNNGDRTFTALPPIAVGDQPRAIVAAPLVGPLPDLVVVNAASNTVTILVNQGSGTFIGLPAMAVGLEPSGVGTGDLDNDKDLDVVVTNGGSQSMTLIRNDGGGLPGSFSAPIHLPLEGTPLPGGLAIWDMDVDGDQDIVVVADDNELEDSIVRVLRNDTSEGPMSFTLFPPIGAAENPKLVSGADTSGDKTADLVAVNVSDILLDGGGGGAGRGSPFLSIRPTLIETTPACPADINSDGTVNVSDLLAVINAWGPCPNPCPPSCAADIVPNCVVNVSDLLAVINGWGACPR